MGTKRKYESEPKKAYATSDSGQIVSRSLFAVVERSDMPLDGGFGEAQIIEVTHPFRTEEIAQDQPLRVRVDTVPQDTIARNPNEAAAMAIAMQSLSEHSESPLGFKVEYSI
jgi:hypothetical protein